jgi:hypothetical protein
MRLHVLSLAYRRTEWWDAIARCLSNLGVPVSWTITATRGHDGGTLCAAARAARRYSIPTSFAQTELSPLASGCPEAFMPVRQFQWKAIANERRPGDYAVLWDDDQVLEDPGAAATILADEPDLVYATKEFFWDRTDQVARHLPVHRSVFFFKCLPGDEFPQNRIIHAPARIHDTAKVVVDFPGKLLDYGYLTEADRNRCWREYKGAGKLDPATLALIRPPVLCRYP